MRFLAWMLLGVMPIVFAKDCTFMAVGDCCNVTLHGNITTGYRWNVLQMPSFLTKEEHYQEDVHPQNKVGVGGKFLFKFCAKEPGVGVIVFHYQRPWEQDPLDTHSQTVRVQ